MYALFFRRVAFFELVAGRRAAAADSFFVWWGGSLLLVYITLLDWFLEDALEHRVPFRGGFARGSSLFVPCASLVSLI